MVVVLSGGFLAELQSVREVPNNANVISGTYHMLISQFERADKEVATYFGGGGHGGRGNNDYCRTA